MTITITLHATGSISGPDLPLYGPVRYRVDQRQDGTVVTRLVEQIPGRPLAIVTETVQMPAPRYALCRDDATADGVPGRDEFERDFLAAIAREER